MNRDVSAEEKSNSALTDSSSSSSWCAGFPATSDFLRDGPDAAGLFLQAAHGRAVPGHDAESVLVDLGFEEFLGGFGRGLGVRAQDEQGPVGHLDRDVVDPRQCVDRLIGDLGARLEDLRQPAGHLFFDLPDGCAVSPALDSLPEILDVREVPDVVVLLVEVPALLLQFVECFVEFGDAAVRNDQVFNEGRLRQALDGIDALGERSRQEQLGGLCGRVVALVVVHDLRVGRAVGAGHVLRQSALELTDADDLLAHVRDLQIEMLAADEIDLSGLLALPNALEHLRDELHQPAGLAVVLVLLEKGDDVLDGRVERIRSDDLVGDLFRRTRDGLGALRQADGFAVVFRDLLDF